MFNDAVSAAVAELTRQDFFFDLTGRTVSRCERWVRDVLSGKATVSLTGLVADAITATSRARDCGCPDSRECDSCIESTAATLIRTSGLVPAGIRQVDDVPDACTVIHASSPAQLLTDPVMRTLCDLAPAGAALFDQVGAGRIRAALIDTAELDRDVLGHDTLIPYLGSGVRHEYLEQANTLLLQADTALTVLEVALAQTMSDGEYSQDLAFRRELDADAASLPRPLYLPRRHQAVRALEQLAVSSDNPQTAAVRDMLIATLDARRTRGSVEQELRDEVVWAGLLAASKLPAADLDSHTNRARLEALTGVFPHPRAFRAYPALRRCVAGAMDVGRPRGRAHDPDADTVTRPSQVHTVADALAVVTGFVADNGRMPHHRELDADLVADIESVLGTVTFNDWCDQLAAIHGVSRRKRSENELQLDWVVGAALGNDLVHTEEEWTCPDTFERPWRVDTKVTVAGPVRTELYLEADGQGHFEQVRDWDHDKTRANDRRKAAALRERIRVRKDAGQDGLLLAVHHRLLSGPESLRLTPQQVTDLLQAARDEGAWWLFVRPAGCADKRSSPGRGGPRRLDVGHANLEVFVRTW